MLKLFQSIFGSEPPGRYPDSLVEAAIERAVDGIDSRLRTLPGYRKLLRAPVVHAIDHVVALVDGLPAPVAATRSHYGDDVHLRTLFASADRMLDILANDTALNEFRDSPSAAAVAQVNALLLVEHTVKHVMGIELDGEMLRRDVAQVAMNFRGHRLVDPAVSEEEVRRQLKRRAFDCLLSLGLTRIADVTSERADLQSQRTLLRRKLDALRRGGWSFDQAQSDGSDAVALQAELEDTERQLAALGVDHRTLHANLDIAAAILADAEQQLWSVALDMRLDRMNIERDAQDATARMVSFQELHDAPGRHLIMLPVSITLDELPRRADFFTAAQRYLG